MIGTLFVALYAAHMVGDHWAQTSAQAACKGHRGAAGRWPCARHVATLTLVKVLFVAGAILVSGERPNLLCLALGLAIDAASHYWADRRFTLAGLAERTNRGGFYRLGAPRPGRDDNPSLGTGAYALDQSWHIGWLFVAVLISSF